MKISISITPKEASQLIKELHLDPIEFFEVLSKFGVTGNDTDLSNDDTPNNYSLEMLYDWFEKISWQTFYFSHLIAVHAEATGQQDNHGYFLDSSQLTDLGISERSAASRVGGSRRVCKAINSIDILFIRTQNKEKRKKFYINSDAVKDLLLIVEEHEKEYREALKDIGEEFPII